MSALNYLASLLQSSVSEETQPIRSGTEIDVLLEQLKARAKSRVGREPVHDHQLDAVRRYWQSHEVSTFRDAYLLSFGLCIPHRPQGECVMEDRPRLQHILDSVDGYITKTASYRRCYQGLAKSYFSFDVDACGVASSGRKNWLTLRDYLHDRNPKIRDSRSSPSWVDTAIENRQLFDESPCTRWTCPCMTGHAVTLRLENLLAGETRVASGISRRCADATRCSGRTQWPGSAAPFWRRAWASTKRNHASSF